MEQNPTPYGGPPIGPPGGAPPKNWLVESILVTLFCCLPLGIAAIINASSVNTKYAAGDYAGAEQASAQAAKWVKFGAIGGFVGGIIYLALAMLGALGS